ncbi:PAS domain S-box protein [Daejeonella sp.]|uniref:PAS domain-containing response regulator n=1 Tax=Daejeonella sp. TaxID=2805397 RepID=UPI00272F781B|nr:PAS domain S-box protein [Daejeonella sp.]MDP2415299.1 PAS domain S-box protein [Daejeonella sp.]
MVKFKMSCRVLVVEDNPGDLAIIEDFLTEQILNPFIAHASNFKQASEVLSAGDALFDIILLDLTLPHKGGQDLVTDILEAASLIPIIILTGYADIDFSTKSISKGISDYLIKDDLNSTTLFKSIIYAIERSKASLQLKESEKRYSDLFHLSPQPMWIFDLESYRFLKVNDAAVRNYGYTKNEFLSMTIKDIRPEEDIPIVEEAVNFYKEFDKRFAKAVYRHKRKNGDIIYVEIQSDIFYFKNRKARLILANDITERVQYIKTVEDQNKKLQDIAWIQSHVVRAPLARMMGIINILTEIKSEYTEYEEWFNNLVNCCNELDHIIRDIVKKAEDINTNIQD